MRSTKCSTLWKAWNVHPMVSTVQAHATDTDISDKVDPGECRVWNGVLPERHNLTGFFGEIWLYNDTTFVLKCTGGASLFDFVAFFNSFASWWFASNIKNWPRTLTTVCPAVLSYWSLLTIVLQFDSHTCLLSGSAKRYHCAMLFKQK